MRDENHEKAFMFPAICLLVLAIVWRVVSAFTHGYDFGWLHNFAPLSAIALCGAIFLPRRFAFALPLGALLISDLILNPHYGFPLLSIEMVARYVALALIATGGLALRTKPQAGWVLGSSALGSVLFYVLTNTGSWLTQTNPGYAKTFGGWVQALTTGLPGLPETWTFYRHTFISDLLFTALLLVCFAGKRREVAAPAPVSVS
jgi:hypothetical protein